MGHGRLGVDFEQCIVETDLLLLTLPTKEACLDFSYRFANQTLTAARIWVVTNNISDEKIHLKHE